jgi:hypothetical protein
MTMQDTLFTELLGRTIKAPFRDGKHIKVARGRLEAVQGGFIKVKGERGLILINTNNVEKITALD